MGRCRRQRSMTDSPRARATKRNAQNTPIETHERDRVYVATVGRQVTCPADVSKAQGDLPSSSPQLRLPPFRLFQPPPSRLRRWRCSPPHAPIENAARFQSVCEVHITLPPFLLSNPSLHQMRKVCTFLREPILNFMDCIIHEQLRIFF